MSVLDCEDHAVLFTDGNGFFEELFDLIRRGGCDDVEVFWLNAEKHIANAATGPEGLMAGLFEYFDDLEGGGMQGKVKSNKLQVTSFSLH